VHVRTQIRNHTHSFIKGPVGIKLLRT